MFSSQKIELIFPHPFKCSDFRFPHCFLTEISDNSDRGRQMESHKFSPLSRSLRHCREQCLGKPGWPFLPQEALLGSANWCFGPYPCAGKKKHYVLSRNVGKTHLLAGKPIIWLPVRRHFWGKLLPLGSARCGCEMCAWQFARKLLDLSIWKAKAQSGFMGARLENL